MKCRVTKVEIGTAHPMELPNIRVYRADPRDKRVHVRRYVIRDRVRADRAAWYVRTISGQDARVSYTSSYKFILTPKKGDHFNGKHKS